MKSVRPPPLYEIISQKIFHLTNDGFPYHNINSSQKSFLSGIAQITSTIITIPMAITVTIADIGSNIGPHSLTVAAMEREVNIVIIIIIIIIITSSSSIGIIIRENSSLQFLPLSFALALAL